MSGVSEWPWLWPGYADLSSQVVGLRWTLLALACLWALLALRAPRLGSLVGGVLFTLTAVGFWIASLGRPYGLLDHPSIVRELAAGAISAARGVPSALVVGEPWLAGPWAWLARAGLPQAWFLNLPTVLPLLVLPLLAVCTALAWRSPHASLGAVLVMIFGTGALDMQRGFGLLPGLWAHPAGSCGLLLALTAGLMAWGARGLARWSLGVLALCGVALAVAGPQALPAPRGLEALLLVSFDQWPWWLLAAPVLGAPADGAARAPRVLVLVGLASVIAAACGLPLDAWGGQALLRIGLLLGAAETLGAWLPQAGAWLARIGGLKRWAPGSLGLAALIGLTAPGSLLAWWQPVRQDGALHASLEGVPLGQLEALRFLRTATPADAVFVASTDYAASVGVLGARRVLRAPTLVVSADDRRRKRVEYLALFPEGAAGGQNARRYELTHVFVGPGDLAAWGFDGPADIEARGRVRLLFANAQGFRVYALQGWDAGGDDTASPAS